MPKKLAIDWDESELRLVAAQCSGTSVKVTDTALIPLQDGDIAATLRQAIEQRGLERTETLVAIGRGKAELRDLQVPAVPDEELPDMVRFQAIRSFASAGDSATVDYLITDRSDKTISMLAAAVGPTKLKEIQDTCHSAELSTKRIALRPLAAASLFLAKQKSIEGLTVLIDLLADDAEIVVARDRKVIFVRTVRMPRGDSPQTAKALVGELKRSLMACGSSEPPDQVILWGREDVHRDDVAKLSEATGKPVEVIDPFDLVDVGRGTREALPDHVGRLAPLVGLLQSDEVGSERLIDFLNPRKRIIKEPNPIARIFLIGVPIAALLLVGFFVYKQFADLDEKISQIKTANAEMTKPVEDANKSVARTERIDQFLDGNVNWLNEIRLLASKMPDSQKMIVKSIQGSTDQRNGGGTLVIAGGVTGPEVIDEFEEAIRDDAHQVVGDGSKLDERAKDAYRWAYNEKITIDRNHVRQLRYAGLKAVQAEPSPADAVTEDTTATDDTTATEDTDETEAPATEETPADDTATETDSSQSPEPNTPAPDTPEPDKPEPEPSEPSGTDDSASATTSDQSIDDESAEPRPADAPQTTTDAAEESQPEGDTAPETKSEVPA
ncbi:MAG: hypothetical protein HKN47_16565 [Pirellulaceae bacterium]|nr:hypothetical protein [Pirellulaceae bacterium]